MIGNSPQLIPPKNRPDGSIPSIESLSELDCGWREGATVAFASPVTQTLQTVERQRVSSGRRLDMAVLLQWWYEGLREGICVSFAKDWRWRRCSAP